MSFSCGSVSSSRYYAGNDDVKYEVAIWTRLSAEKNATFLSVLLARRIVNGKQQQLGYAEFTEGIF